MATCILICITFIAFFLLDFVLIQCIIENLEEPSKCNRRYASAATQRTAVHIPDSCLPD